MIMGKTIQTLIIVLVLVATGLAYFILTQSNQNEILRATSISRKQSEISIPYQSRNPSALSQISSADRAVVFMLPYPKESSAERINFDNLTAKLARNVDILSINKCTPDVLIARVSLAKNFTIKNTDAVDHQISFANQILKVPKNGSLVIDSSKVFMNGRGKYRYSCDKSNLVGVFYVVQ